MTEPAQTIRAEIARVREEHRGYTYPPGNCSLCGQSYPCDAIRLAAAQEVTVNALERYAHAASSVDPWEGQWASDTLIAAAKALEVRDA